VVTVVCSRAPGVRFCGAWFWYMSASVYVTLYASSSFLYCLAYQERDFAMA
jgi:hypothetical protein